MGSICGVLVATSMTSRPAKPPVLTSLDYDLADTAGGDRITLTGTDLGSATCQLGANGLWRDVVVTANTATSVTFVVPELAAPGLFEVRVTTSAGKSNKLTIEAWSPADEPGCTLFAEAPNYVAGGPWTSRVGGNFSTTAGGQPPGLNGAPCFDGSATLVSAADGNDLVSQAGGTLAVVAHPTNESPYDLYETTPYNHWSIVAKATSGPFGFYNANYASAGGRHFGWFMYDVAGAPAAYRSVKRAFSALNTTHAIAGTYQEATSMSLSVDGSSFTKASRALTSHPIYPGGKLLVGADYAGGRGWRGHTRAIAAYKGTKGDAFASRWAKWAALRHGSSPSALHIDVDLCDTAGGDIVSVRGYGLGGATATLDGAPIAPLVSTAREFRFAMPAKAAGVYELVLTLADASTRTFAIEAWDPSVDPDVTLLFDSSVAPYNPVNGQWVPRFSRGVELSLANQKLIQGITSPAAPEKERASNGAPVFEGLGSAGKTSGLVHGGWHTEAPPRWRDYLGFAAASGQNFGSIAIVASSTNQEPILPASPYNIPGMAVGLMFQGTIGIGFGTQDGVGKAFLHTYHYGYKLVAAAAPLGATRAVVGRWGYGTTTLDISVDGALSGDGYASLPTIGGHQDDPYGKYRIELGLRYPAQSWGSQTFAGTIYAFAVLKAQASNTFITKWNKWKRARGFGLPPSSLAASKPTLLYDAPTYDAAAGTWTATIGTTATVTGAIKPASNGGFPRWTPAGGGVSEWQLRSTSLLLTITSTTSRHVLARVTTASILDANEAQTTGVIVRDQSAWFILKLHRTGTPGAYKYWATHFDFDNAYRKVVVEITSYVDENGAGTFTLQARKRGGTLQLKVNDAPFVSGDACGPTGGGGYIEIGAGVQGTVRTIAMWPSALSDDEAQHLWRLSSA